MSIFLALAMGMTSLPPTNWPVGVEREVDEGVYAAVVYQQNGWRVWRFEERTGVTCMAVKSAAGRPHPVPIGVGKELYRGTPWISITFNRHASELVAFHGQHLGRVRTEWRQPGARFWTPFEPYSVTPDFGTGRIEVHVVSWRYPASLVGMADERATIDLQGIEAVRVAGRDCTVAAG